MTMDYEKKYKELIEKIELISHSALTVEQHQIIDTILGELKESEDEKVRKEIVEYLKKNLRLEWATWLEKQGEVESDNDDIEVEEKGIREAFNKIEDEKQCKQKPFDYENANIQQRDWAEIPFGTKDSELQEATYNIPQGYYAEIEDNKMVIKQGEQKPKFKVGDWIIFAKNHNSVYQVERIDSYRYYLRHYLGGTLSVHFDNELIRLWTIQEAKDGDVLVASDKSIFIYDGSINENGSVGFHIAFTEDMDIILNSDDGCGWEEKDSCHPSTKEQRDLLFQKMHEAGYEWDADKKELKKISQRMISAEAKEAMYAKTAWSEEDEKMVDNILTPLATRCPFEIYQPMYNWLKSLKQRIGG